MSLASLTGNLIETLYRFEGSEMKIEELQGLAKAEEREKQPVKRKVFEGGGSRLGSRTAAKQIPQTRSRNSAQQRLGRDRTLKTTQEVRNSKV